jgi:hypothetical protein
MCPLCISAGALVAAGATSSAGIGALIIALVRRQPKEDDHDRPQQ